MTTVLINLITKYVPVRVGLEKPVFREDMRVCVRERVNGDNVREAACKVHPGNKQTV